MKEKGEHSHVHPHMLLIESNDQCVTTSVSCNDEDRDPDFYHTISLPLPIKPVDNVTTAEEDEIINRELSKNEPFAIKQSSVSDDFIEAKCSTKFSSASACNGEMELEENLQEKDDKATSNEDLDRPSCSIGDSESRNYTPTENAEPNASANNLHVARLPKGKHRRMWTLIHRHVISDEYTESDSKVTCGADEENHKFCAAESSYSLLKFSERESMTTNQDADNQGVEARKFLAIKLVREATERILLPEVQDQSSDNQSVTSEGIGKAEKIQPKKARYLELEPDPEAEKVNLKHQIEDERKRTEEWMLDYALQQAISQLAPTQKREVGLLVTAFETVVPPQRSNIQVKFPKMKTRNEDNLQMEDNVLEKYSTHVDKRNAEDDWSMLKNEDTQKTIVLCQKSDEVTTTSSDKVSVDGEGKPEVKEEENLKLEPEARINVSKASHEKEKGISFTASKLCNDCDETQENNMIVPSASECDEKKKITEAEDEDGTHRKQVNKQNHISVWHMISQHILSDVVSKVGSDQLLEGTVDEVNDNKKLAEIITDNSLRDISRYGRSFSRNDASAQKSISEA
ncbi:hypothetical protein K7X08_037418 [Anisodus acutangulus]|uniref:Calmodulin-binding domain-containing protein n=1 Tax=Anisodus acutangulus TaxID=402998 RepID=A0A9Q1RS03_9SOLA|nr:hypothetical protein K7X08_037418 [Anisodus acutangulus]